MCLLVGLGYGVIVGGGFVDVCVNDFVFKGWFVLLVMVRLFVGLVMVIRF